MSVPPGTEMFQFPGFAPTAYVFSRRYPIGVGCPIRMSTDQSLLAAPRGFSQRATSFVASWCQGIHRTPLLRSTLKLLDAPTKRASKPTTRRNHPRTRPRQNPGQDAPGATRAPHSAHTHFSCGAGGHHTRRAAAPLFAAPPVAGGGRRRSPRGGATHPSVRNAITRRARSRLRGSRGTRPGRVRKDRPGAARAGARQNLIHGGKDRGGRPPGPTGDRPRRTPNPTHGPRRAGRPKGVPTRPGPNPTPSHDNRQRGRPTAGEPAAPPRGAGPAASGLVEATGLEPATPCLQSRCSPS